MLDQSKKLYCFRAGPQSIFAWCFVPGVAEVAYENGLLHFSNEADFDLRRISDGCLLATLSFPDQSIAESAAASFPVGAMRPEAGSSSEPPWVL